MRIVLKSFTTILFLIVFFLLVSSIYYIFQAKGDIEKVPSIFGYKALTVLSNSMKPAISAGDIILINNNNMPKVNDIVTYKHPEGILVSHRVIEIVTKNHELFFKMKGDNNNTDDHIFVPKKAIIGIERGIIPKAGYAAKFASGPIGFFILIVFPIVLFLIIEIFERVGIIDNKKIQV